MAAIVKFYREYWDEALAVGLGVVVTDVVGNTVKGWVGPFLTGIGIDPKWFDSISELLIGFGLAVFSEFLAPVGWKVYLRLAAFGATAVGIADAVAIALGLVAPPAAGRPAGRPVVRRTPARPGSPAKPSTMSPFVGK